MESFQKKNPEVKQRKAQRLNLDRVQKINKFIVEDHFAKLQKLLVDNNSLDFPEKIFNEKGCRFQLHKNPPVFARKGVQAHAHCCKGTCYACGNAIGYVIRLMILFAGLRKKLVWKKGLSIEYTTKMTPKSCMEIKTFVEFLRHFSRFKPSGLKSSIF